MPARVVVIHDDPSFLDPLVAALEAGGHDVIAFESSMTAWDAFRAASKIEILITRIPFGGGQPHGVALAGWARMKRPEVRVIFTALPEFQDAADGVGLFIPVPVEIPRVAEIVTRLLLNDPTIWPV